MTVSERGRLERFFFETAGISENSGSWLQQSVRLQNTLDMQIETCREIDTGIVV